MQLLVQALTLLGSICLFLYGMSMMSEGLQKAAVDKLRAFLAKMTSTPLRGIITGIIITALIQSSSGTTVMVVSMVNAGLLSLCNAIGVIMGANIGTTVTTWIISLFGFGYNIGAFAIPFIALGMFLTFSKSSKTKSIGEVIIGFALLLIGLATMKDSVPDLNEYPDALAMVQNLTAYGFGSILIFVLIGALLTMIVQASSAAMALTMVFLANGWVDFQMASAMVLGSNIGTTITANIAAAVGNYSARRTAIAHTLFNFVGVIIALIFFNPMMFIIGELNTAIGLPNPVTAFAGGVDYQGHLPVDLQNSMFYGVCFLHTIFNLANTIILVWFIPQIEAACIRIIPTPEGEEEVFRLKYIHGGPLSTAELSLDEAQLEILHFGEICRKGLKYVSAAVNAADEKEFEEARAKLDKYENITDKIEFEIATYLSEVSKGDISAESSARIKGMYKIIGEMESLGDSGEAIGRMLSRKNDHGKSFDEEQIRKINRMIDLLDESYGAMIDNLREPYASLKDISAAKLAESNIDDYRNYLREEHIVNIEDNKEYNYQTGVFYMDIISEIEKMGDFIINVSEALQVKGV